MRRAGSAILLVAALSACSTNDASSQGGEPFYVRHSMQAQVNPAVTRIWDVGNAAMDDTGGIDPALMDDAQWKRLAEASAALEASGRKMAAAHTLRAAEPENWATEEFAVSMDQVQAALDADPEQFRQLAAGLAEHAAQLNAAAQARDAGRAGEIVAQMDSICAGCHTQFWGAE